MRAIRSQRARPARVLVLAIVAALAGLVLAACGSSDDNGAVAPAEPAAAAEAPDAAPADFETALSEASERAQQAVEEALAPLSDADGTVGPVGAGALAETFPAAKAAIDEYATEVEALTAPETFESDQARHVVGLEELSKYFEDAIAADTARDQERADALVRDIGSTIRNLAADLSPQYAALAFIAPEAAGADVFVGLSPEESDYLDSAAAAQEEFASRVSKFGAALGQSYTSTEQLLNALYEAGAGEAFAAVQAVAVAIEPPPRFAADHDRWLTLLEEQVRLDRLIGEAARDGDIVQFEVNNHLLGLAARDADAEFSVEFATASAPPGTAPPRPDLDPESAIAHTAYGPELFDRMKPFFFGPESSYAFFPQTPDEAILEAIPLIAPAFAEHLARGRAAVDELSPPPEHEADHERILQYFDELLANQEAVLAAAEAGDLAAVREAIDATGEPLCSAAADLSDEVLPAAAVFGIADMPPPFCPA